MLLEVKHLTYKAIDERYSIILILSGETVAVVGPSGSGKSTFLKQLNNLISPTEGELLFKGKPYDEYSPEELRSKISYMMQQSELFGTTVEDNMAFPALTHHDHLMKIKRMIYLIKSACQTIV